MEIQLKKATFDIEVQELWPDVVELIDASYFEFAHIKGDFVHVKIPLDRVMEAVLDLIEDRPSKVAHDLCSATRTFTHRAGIVTMEME